MGCAVLGCDGGAPAGGAEPSEPPSSVSTAEAAAGTAPHAAPQDPASETGVAGAGEPRIPSSAARAGNAVAGAGDTAGAGGTAASGGSAASAGVPAAGRGEGGAGGLSSAGFGSGAGAAAPALQPLTVYLAGDSTVSTYEDTPSERDQAGWGQMLPEFLDELASVDNRAIGGRTSRRFIDEGRLDELGSLLRPGDYLLAQFGTNDGNRTASYMLGNQTIPYFLEPGTDFKRYMQRYIEVARDKGAIPVLVTPPPRNSAYCTGGNGTGAYAQAMRELGESMDTAVVDLNRASVDYLQAICPEPSPPDFFLERADGTVDGTHFQERGAKILAGFVAEGLRAAGAPFVAEAP